MRTVLLLPCLLLAACDQSSVTLPPKPADRETTVNPLNAVPARLAFTCRHETLPEPAADTDILFKYARWLQVNNLLQADEAVDTEAGRLYRIAAENGHPSATINLLNGSLRGHFGLTAGERLRFARQLTDAGVASGDYFIAIYLQYGAAGLAQDEEMALRYYRKAADGGSPQAQAYVGEKLSPLNMAPDIARQMRRCAAEQGEGEAAGMLGIDLQERREYQKALEAFQLGVAAGHEISALALEEGFNGPAPDDGLNYLGQQQDPERVRRYKAIGNVLSNYSYASPVVPEISEIVPLPPAPLPAWDGTLQWLKAREASVPPEKPSAALTAELAKKKQLNPATGKPLPSSPDFAKFSITTKMTLCV
ncbi:DUF6396 domain-containing protein [Enterobacteriaceae bacterium LUAb1]